MKKVLHILNSLLPSGVETMLCCSADYWSKDLEVYFRVGENSLDLIEGEKKQVVIKFEFCKQCYEPSGRRAVA